MCVKSSRSSKRYRYIFTEGHLVCGVVRERVKQKGVDTVEADGGKGYREQR